MIVMKFGGTSNRDAGAMSNVCRIIASHLPDRPVVVISAISSATNDLEASARAAAAGDDAAGVAILRRLHSRHLEIMDALVRNQARARDLRDVFASYVNELESLLHGVAILRELTPRTMDAVCSFGERFSSRLVCAALAENGVESAWVDAKEFMLTDSNFGRALPLMDPVTEKFNRVVVPLLERGQVPVTQGFIGVTESGAYTTMGRESSDYSASIIGAALHASRVQIWTDVDGILTADPRVVRNVRKIRRLTFDEAFELSYFGAKVLHPNTMLPLMERNIPVEIRNSRNGEGTGTVIERESGDTAGDTVVKCVSFSRDVSVVSVSPRKRSNQYLFWEAVFSILSRSGIEVKSLTTSEFRIAFTVTGPFDSTAVIPSLEEFGNVAILSGQSSLCIVGTGIRECAGFAGRVFGALAGVRISLIAYGASGRSLTLVVDASALDDALQGLHEEFFASPDSPDAFDVPFN